MSPQSDKIKEKPAEETPAASRGKNIPLYVFLAISILFFLGSISVLVLSLTGVINLTGKNDSLITPTPLPGSTYTFTFEKGYRERTTYTFNYDPLLNITASSDVDSVTFIYGGSEMHILVNDYDYWYERSITSEVKKLFGFYYLLLEKSDSAYDYYFYGAKMERASCKNKSRECYIKYFYPSTNGPSVVWIVDIKVAKGAPQDTLDVFNNIASFFTSTSELDLIYKGNYEDQSYYSNFDGEDYVMFTLPYDMSLIPERDRGFEYGDIDDKFIINKDLLVNYPEINDQNIDKEFTITGSYGAVELGMPSKYKIYEIKSIKSNF